MALPLGGDCNDHSYGGHYDYGSIQPRSVVAYVGQNVTLVCFSYTIPFWIQLNGVIETKVITPVLILVNVTEKHTGKYMCKGYNISGVPFRAYSDIYVGGK